YCLLLPPLLHSFPTRRSSDLITIPTPMLKVRYLSSSRTFPISSITVNTGKMGQLPFLISTDVPSGKIRGTLSERSERAVGPSYRSEEHTSELQSRSDLVCRLL